MTDAAAPERTAENADAGAVEAAAHHPDSAGWIVGNGDGTKWRQWTDWGPEWTSDRASATRFARREDAEAVHGGDEDAWTVQAYSSSERKD